MILIVSHRLSLVKCLSHRVHTGRLEGKPSGRLTDHQKAITAALGHKINSAAVIYVHLYSSNFSHHLDTSMRLHMHVYTRLPAS